MKVWTVHHPAAAKVRVTDQQGVPILGCYRIEFDGEGDEGMATVSRYDMSADGTVILKRATPPVDAEGNGITTDGRRVLPEPSRITEHRWVKVVVRDTADVNNQQADNPVEVRS